MLFTLPGQDGQEHWLYSQPVGDFFDIEINPISLPRSTTDNGDTVHGQQMNGLLVLAHDFLDSLSYGLETK